MELNLAAINRLDFEGWNRADWNGEFAHLHTADVVVEVKGTETTHSL